MKQHKLVIKIAPVLIIIAAMLWAADGVVRRSLYTLSPVVVVFYEHLFGFLILLPLVLVGLKKIRLDRKQIIGLIWVSLVSGLLGTLWFTQALVKTEFISFSVVFLIQKLQPIFAIAMAGILLKEKLTRRYLVWAGIGLGAAFILAFPQGIGQLIVPSSHQVAALLALGAAVAWGSSTPVSKYLLQSQSQTNLTFMRFFLTSIWTLGYILFFDSLSILSTPSAMNLGWILGIALSTGIVAIWLYYTGLSYVQAKVATILELALPVTAILIDVFWFKTTLLPIQILAATVMLLSMYQITHKSV